MEKKLEIEVKLISREIIKPSSATPSHPKILKLSLLDQNFPAIHIPVLLFYPSRIISTSSIDVSSLKTSLSETLCRFYPLAGRCIDESTVDCNDEGIPFFETQVSCPLSTILTSRHKLDLLTNFLPPRDLLALGPRPINELVPLAFQVNVFECGGVVIGCYMLHKLLDAASFGNFIKYWADITIKRYDDLVEPDFDCIVKTFPPCPYFEGVTVPDLSKNRVDVSQPIQVVVRSTRFNQSSIKELRVKAAIDLVPNPTKFEALAGFVWDRVLSAAATHLNAENRIRPTTVSISINMRTRLNPPLPKGSMGNLLTNAHAHVSKWDGWQDLVKEIHEAVSMVHRKIETFQGENGAEVLRADREADSKHVIEQQKAVYQLTSWCKLGLEEVDFGFGKPNWIIPTEGRVPPSLRNFIFFTDYYVDENDYGIEAWFFLEEKEMQTLTTDSLFSYYATPN